MIDPSNIVLVNGSREVRVRSSEGVVVLDCGCAHTATHWLQMCRPDFETCDALHRAALAAHRGEAAPALDPLLE